ncbi:DUF2336 domain-containing protein [Rhodocista pekingensis]|uniref:DUF2336 domain-containing protein n=1 Tax=Rhodocista pekingensis TaxID=201185 RepID=A0ABW2L0V2_9PROT
MARQRTRLTRSDVDRLLREPGPHSRIETMAKLVADLEAGLLTQAEHRLALEVLGAFATDAEAEVRSAVAWQIHNSPVLTTDLAERLARDVARVAFPILRHVDRLTDELLLEIVAEHDPHKQLAIAGRRRVSAEVATALVETGNLVTVVHLLRNRGAHVAAATLERAVERFGQIRTVADAVAARPELPLALVERLIAFVSEDIRRRLVEDHGLEPQLAARLSQRGREAATLRLLKPLLLRAGDAELMARHLHWQGRLTPHFLFRALCGGDLPLFVAGMAERGGIAVGSAEMLVWDDGALGLRTLFDAARIPAPLHAPFRTAIRTAKDSGFVGGLCGREAFQVEVLARLFEECGDIEEREVDELLLQVCDQPGASPADMLLPLRA